MRAQSDRVAGILAASLVLLVVVEALLASHHDPVFPWHRLPGYSALIGVIACIALVLPAKALGKRFLQRQERDD